jgi:hypothetical protein
MTDRHAGYLVTLDTNVRDDDAQPTIAAILQIKGVLSVDPIINTGEMEVRESIAKTRAKHWIWEQLRKFLLE